MFYIICERSAWLVSSWLRYFSFECFIQNIQEGLFGFVDFWLLVYCEKNINKCYAFQMMHLKKLLQTSDLSSLTGFRNTSSKVSLRQRKKTVAFLWVFICVRTHTAAGSVTRPCAKPLVFVCPSVVFKRVRNTVSSLLLPMFCWVEIILFLPKTECPQ